MVERLATVSMFRGDDCYDTDITANTVSEAARNALRFLRSSKW
jgi:hypothetical protein